MGPYRASIAHIFQNLYAMASEKRSREDSPGPGEPAPRRVPPPLSARENLRADDQPPVARQAPASPCVAGSLAGPSDRVQPHAGGANRDVPVRDAELGGQNANPLPPGFVLTSGAADPADHLLGVMDHPDYIDPNIAGIGIVEEDRRLLTNYALRVRLQEANGGRTQLLLVP